MFVRILTLLCFIPALVSAQAPDYTFYNKGAGVYIQPDALVHIQGTLTNDNGSTNGLIQNDGVIEIKKDIENKTNAIFRDDNGSGSSHKAVRFVGSGKQVIAGDFSTGNNSFFNLIVDQTSATDSVEMRTNVNVKVVYFLVALLHRAPTRLTCFSLSKAKTACLKHTMPAASTY